MLLCEAVEHKGLVGHSGLFHRFPELAEHPIRGQPRQDFLAEIGVMAGPWVIVGSVDHIGPNRIQVDVPHQFKEIAVAIDQNCLEAALKKMAGAAFSPVDPASIAEGKVLQTA